MSEPVGPTAISVDGENVTQSTPERYPARSPPCVQVVPPSRVKPEARAPLAGAVKSPPTMTPSRGLRNASENTPPASAGGIGAATAVQVRPPSREWNTRAAPPPLANHASRPLVTRQVPLAANANSPATAGGIPSLGRRCQLRPQSSVAAIRNLPSTGSLRARPRLPPA